MPLQKNAAVILLDIEGTISSQSYVLNVLYPYSRERIPGYVAAHRHEPEIAAILAETTALAEGGDPVAALIAWQDADLKKPPLKTLQGLIWHAGYGEGAFTGHLFADAFAALGQWRDQNKPAYIFSSGSRQAQVQFFEHSQFGDASGLFAGHFDTAVGAKVESSSYARIAARIGVALEAILFFSDNPRELVAARDAGVQVIHVVKEDTPPDPRFEEISDFSQVVVA